MMRRLFPAPWLSLALWGLWLLLNLSVSPGQMLLGALFAWAAPWLMAPLRPHPLRLSKPGTVLRLVGRVGVDVVISNLQVAGRILTARGRPPRSAFVRIPLELHDHHGLAALAAICSVIPGTVWCELSLDRTRLLMHVFDLDDESHFIAHFKHTYERPLREIFE